MREVHYLRASRAYPAAYGRAYYAGVWYWLSASRTFRSRSISSASSASAIHCPMTAIPRSYLAVRRDRFAKLLHRSYSFPKRVQLH